MGNACVTFYFKQSFTFFIRMFILLSALSIFALVSLSTSCDLALPEVFDAHFYLNTHPDLEHANLHTPELAANHWCTNGIKEGRQATSSFHSLQYLDNYPDLQEVFGDDYEAVIAHYVNVGIEEGRIGYLEGGGQGRWTVRSKSKVRGSNVFLSCSKRTGGAVDSLVWNNKEFINNWDHGRQLQTAMTVQNYGECWNPTEAGGRSDGIDKETKTILTNITAAGNVLNTVSLPAYWVRGDDTTRIPSGKYCPAGQGSYNSEDTHPYEFRKNVTIGCFDLDNCIEFAMIAELGDSPDMPPFTGFAQLEAPTAYLNSDFTDVSYLDAATGTLEHVDYPTKEETEQLVIIHTKDEEHALAAVTKPRLKTSSGAPGLHYGYFKFNIQKFDQKTFKWSVVIREDLQPSEAFEVTTYLCVGALDMVVECLLHVQEEMFFEYEH